MIHNIEPKKLYNEYQPKEVCSDSNILCFQNNSILCKSSGNELTFPTYYQLNVNAEDLIYAFSVDQTSYFLLNTSKEVNLPGYSYENIRLLRTSKPKDIVFSGMVGYHLFKWYVSNKFCGKCGSLFKHGEKERMLYCPQCGNTVYPVIAPAVIVAITDGDRLLMTKYANREYTNYALVAGFAEIGETIEQTVEREVMEEVGLKVKNITYYKSQPWGYSNSLLFGFFAEVEGNTEITLEQNELSEGRWFHRSEIDLVDDDISLTREMIIKFKNS